MKVAVIQSVPIPHVIFLGGKHWSFNPVCEVPEEMGKNLLKTPIFIETQEDISTEGYRIKDEYQGKTLGDLVSKLSLPHQVKVMELVKGLLGQEKLDKEVKTTELVKAQEQTEADSELPTTKRRGRPPKQ